MAATDGLSALPDNLLQHILSFAPAKEAAATTALSRRWRPLWPRMSSINLDSRNYPSSNDDFFRDSNAAFLFRRRRLTLFLEKVVYRVDRWEDYEDEPEDDVRVADLLVSPAAAGLEELRVQCYYDECEKLYSPPLASLSCAATLRVLQLRCCNLEPLSEAPSARLAFPCLTDLALRGCTLLEGYLQFVLDAAPVLTTLALGYLSHRSGSAKKPYYMSKSYHLPLRLRCPTVTALVLETDISSEELEDSRNIGVKLDMPSLRSFRFSGVPVKLSLTSPAPEIARVDLDTILSKIHEWRYVPVSRMLASFSSMRALKLRLGCIEDIITCYGEEQGSVFFLPTFLNLKLLEIDGRTEYMNSSTTLAVMTLLRSCLAMSELMLRLNMTRERDYYRRTKDPVADTFAECTERFNRLMSMSSTDRDIVDLDRVTDIPGNNREFSCLRTSMRKVTLRFKSKEFDCFPVQLAKFLVENAMVLEEMHVEDGCQFWPDHLCHKVARWRADAFRRRNLPDTTGFRVYQL